MPPTASGPSPKGSAVPTRTLKQVILSSFDDKLLVIRYGIAGAIGVASNAATLYVFTEFFGVWYLFSAFVAYVVSLSVAFLLQKFWTFRQHQGNMHAQFATYTIVSLLNLGLDLCSLYVLVEIFGFWYFGSQLFILVFMALLSFLVNRNITFTRL